MSGSNRAEGLQTSKSRVNEEKIRNGVGNILLLLRWGLADRTGEPPSRSRPSSLAWGVQAILSRWLILASLKLKWVMGN